ncbi:MAG: TolC family protein [Paludibacteraceae bacterium]|nr:TolC family protein [Paludibacteraceae bacterium]
MKKKIWTLIFAAVCVFSVTAQDTLKLELSLEAAKQYALEHNRMMQNASLSVKQAYATRWQAIASMLPQVSAGLDYTNMCGYEMNLMNLKMAMPPYGTLSVTASVALSGTQIVAALINNLSIEMSDVNVKKTEQDITSSVTSLYMSILAMEKTKSLLDLNLKNLQTLYESTANAVKVGVMEQTNADQISVQVSSMQSSINTTERSLEMLYNSLALQLGQGVGCYITLTQKLDELLNVEVAMELLHTELDLSKNYDYQLLQKNTELSQKQITMAAMNYVPTLSAYYQYSAKKYFSDEATMNMTAPNMVGVSVKIPIWSSGVRASTITEKKLAYKAAQNTLADTEDALRVQDKQLRYNLTSAYENYQTQTKNLDVSQRVFDNISRKFEQGYASSTDVTNSSITLLAAQSDYVSAMLQMVNAHIELKKLLNK